jgi:hypothetical protein
LILLASALLWAPIAQLLQTESQLGTLAGLASAALGSFLLLRP